MSNQYEYVNPDDLPEGDPLKELILETQRAQAKMSETREEFRFEYNDMIFPLTNQLRDDTETENDFHQCIRIFKEVEEDIFKRCQFTPKEGKPATLRIIAEICLHAAQCCEKMQQKARDEAQRMSDNLKKDDYDHG